MSVADALHCAGCGRDLGLEPVARDGTLACPDCHAPMSVMECGPGALHDCAKCGGQFVEHDAMRDLIERHDRLDARLGRHVVSAGPSVDTRVRYVACPACAALMNRRNFGASSGVIVDVCSKHGTWFDPGELPRVLSFIESGGLARVRRREAEDAAEQRSRRSSAPVVPTSTHDPAAMSLGGTSIAADLIALLFS
jgi:Zn-finger nucleic acid-binding protein